MSRRPPRAKKTQQSQQVTYRIIREPRRPKLPTRLILGVVGLVILFAGLALISWLVILNNENNAADATSVAQALSTGTPRPTPTFDAAAAKASLAARHNETVPANAAGSPPTPASSGQPTQPGGLAGSTAAGGPTVTPTFSGLPLPSPAAGSSSGPTATPTFSGLPLPSTGPVTAPATSTPAPNPKEIAQQQLKAAWASYRQDFIQGDGRVLDPTVGGVSTSEGQSYAMLRAVWEDDRDTFDRVWNWTRTNLQVRQTDRLFAYRWGKADGDKWQVLDPSSASDADADIALALLWASRRWNTAEYAQAATVVVQSLWEKSVVTINNKPYLTAGDWSPAQDRPTLNPSYQAPYAYRLFAAIDPSHNWAGLVDSAYAIVNGCTQAQLNNVSGVGLPPNWCAIDKTTGQFTTAQDFPKLDTLYGYDAFRVMWRLALDYRWNGDKRALDYLKSADTLRQKWNQDGKLNDQYEFNGQPKGSHEDLAVYAGDLANFVLTDPAQADAIVSRKLLPTFQQNGSHAGWGDLQNYYSQNWVWFGLSLYTDTLPTPPPSQAAQAVPATAAPPAATPAATHP